MSNEMKREKNVVDTHGVIDTHEKFIREANKQMVDNLTQIKKDIHTIANWVMFFGVIAILGAILGGCNLIMSF